MEKHQELLRFLILMLFQILVDPEADLQVTWVSDLVGGDEVGTGGGESVEGLALATVFGATHGDVQAAGVAEDVAEAVFQRDGAAVLAHDENQLRLVVDQTIRVGSQDSVLGTYDGAR